MTPSRQGSEGGRSAPRPDGITARDQAGREVLAVLGIVALTGHVLTAGLTLWLSVIMSVDQFAAFAAVSSLFLLGTSIVPLGADRFAMVVLPVALEKEDWNRLSAFRRFALKRLLAGSLGMGVIFLAAGLLADGDFADAILLSAVGLPVSGAVLVATASLAALGRPVLAGAGLKLLMPGAALAILIVSHRVFGPPDAWQALAIWGAGWLAALAALGLWFLRNPLPPRSLRAAEPDDWGGASNALLGLVALGAILERSPVLATGLFADADEVRVLAVAMTLLGPAKAIAQATDAVFFRRLRLGLSRGAGGALREVASERTRLLALLATVTLLLLSALAVWGKRGLDVDPSQGAGLILLFCALGLSAQMLARIRNKALAFRGRTPLVLRTVAIASGIQLISLWLLVPPFGAIGAAGSYSLGGLALLAAHRLVNRP